MCVSVCFFVFFHMNRCQWHILHWFIFRLNLVSYFLFNVSCSLFFSLDAVFKLWTINNRCHFIKEKTGFAFRSRETENCWIFIELFSLSNNNQMRNSIHPSLLCLFGCLSSGISQRNFSHSLHCLRPIFAIEPDDFGTSAMEVTSTKQKKWSIERFFYQLKVKRDLQKQKQRHRRERSRSSYWIVASNNQQENRWSEWRKEARWRTLVGLDHTPNDPTINWKSRSATFCPRKS